MKTEKRVLIRLVAGIALTVCAGVSPPAAGRTIYCDPRSENLGDGDGSSWREAYLCLEWALAMAGAGSEVRVAQGVYQPDREAQPLRGSSRRHVVITGDRNATFNIRPGAVVKGGYAGYGAANPDERDIERYQTILSGDLKGNDIEFAGDGAQDVLEYVTHPSLADNSLTVLTLDDGPDSNTVLDGLTITGGFADGAIEGWPHAGEAPVPHPATDGAGAFLANTTATLIRCRFYRNVTRAALQGAVGGAGVACSGEGTSPTFRQCSFEGNIVFGHASAGYGAGALVSACDPQFVNCTFSGNIVASLDAPCGGGAIASFEADPALTRCWFTGNTADGEGGAIACFTGSPTISNCVFNGNTARFGGALFFEQEGVLSLANCTVTANHASEDGGAVYQTGTGRNVQNCIFWANTPNELRLADDSTSGPVRYNDIQGGYFGSGSEMNIDADPQFRDPVGPDGIAGTLDDDLRLSLGSLCIDTGNNKAVQSLDETDLAGYPRVADGRVDMGAYEFHGPFHFYVDAIRGDDSNPGGSPGKPFATIQRGIDAALDGYTVMVLPGLYTEEIEFQGKDITVMGVGGAPVLEAPGDYAVSFYSAEGPGSVLQNFVIQNSDTGIFIAGSSPTIRNVTLANNEFGIAAYAGANPDISNCVIWGNLEGDLFGCTTRFSCVEQGAEGQGNISTDPLLADTAGGDYHLLAEKGRYVPAYGLWSFDTRTSPCVDAGDPAVDVGAERMPNGGRINMGAFGGTAEASMSEWPLAADINHDGIVDLRDLAIVSDQWLMRLAGAPGPSSGDAAAPQPDPAQWDEYGLPREFSGGGGWNDYWVEMKAVEAVDPSGPVEYFFECRDYPGVVPDGLSSGWQTDPSYTVLVGRENQALRFRVMARDGYGNMTAWSTSEVGIPRPEEPPETPEPRR
ncbi:MAG: right-handed parallel beta-helix repeat-containing protein [Sedimentisphaerales bacterium]|nr:right-handed parallel beta-helix repeat-containing protein [Sedimentisphaerales bacterium]